nr:plasmid replication protein RepC [Loktanella sp. Alg231-35]
MSDTPHGATGPTGFQNSGLVANGWRKVTPALLQADQLADTGRDLAVDKGRAFVAVKRVGAHIGLKSGDVLLLDTLGAFTQAQDWEEGRRPIVWASNAYLMEQTGFSLSALKRHARRLAEAGVISFQDSPNGKRWGRRDVEGVIVEAYGFDLSPMSARAEEFEQLFTMLKAERALCQRLKRQITVARRMIRARIEAATSGALSGPWAQFAGVFEDLLNRLPRRNEASERLMRLLGRFKELQERVEGAYLKAVQPDEVVENTSELMGQLSHITKDLNPSGVISDPHILITNQLDPVTCNSSEKEDAAGVVPNAQPEDQVDSAIEDWIADVRKKRAALDLPVVMQACPEFASWARNMGGYLKDWGDLHRVAGQLRPMIGISEQAWNIAQDQLGKQVATAALALVFEKHSSGEVASPGGYLRGMVEKGRAGELHLERSFFGRLSETAA